MIYNALMHHAFHVHQMKFYERVWGGYVDNNSRSRQTFEKEYAALEQAHLGKLACLLKQRMDLDGSSVSQQQIDAVNALQVYYPNSAFAADVEEHFYLNVLVKDFLVFVASVFQELQ